MGIKKGPSFDTVYKRYLAWFHEKAAAGTAPKEEGEFPAFQLFHEDIYEDDFMILNRVYFTVPLLPAESKTGRLELFAFTELNLLHKAGGEIERMTPIEYITQEL